MLVLQCQIIKTKIIDIFLLNVLIHAEENLPISKYQWDYEWKISKMKCYLEC